jgi:hypothetical protein
MKTVVFWNVKPYSLAKVYQHFGGLAAPIFMIEEWYVKQETSKKQAASRALWHPFLLGLTALEQLNVFIVRSLNKLDNKTVLSINSTHPCSFCHLF